MIAYILNFFDISKAVIGFVKTLQNYVVTDTWSESHNLWYSNFNLRYAFRGIEDLELWLSEIEGQLQSEDFGKDLTSVQNLLKKHALIEADVNSHQDRIDGVKIAADQFCSAGHFDAENIKAKHAALNDRYDALLKPMSARKQKLVDSLAVQQVFRDIEDEEAWIREKEPIITSSNRYV